jgi:hypothetical protein
LYACRRSQLAGIDMTDVLANYYLCSEELDCLGSTDKLSDHPGYFRLGERTICYGRSCLESPSPDIKVNLSDLLPLVDIQGGQCALPFDPQELINNLRLERYVAYGGKRPRSPLVALYYLLRPVLPFSLRSRLKRIWQKGWDTNVFPTWPVDRTVEQIYETLLCLAMKTLALRQVPFVWFWPRGHSACAVMTHDVETRVGLEFCPALMDLNDTFHIKSSFQLVPEGRYPIPQTLSNEVRSRGFEVNVHDWNHDGLLFTDRALFLDRASRINRFAQQHGMSGFRSGALYRNTAWYEAFTFSYDMSVPNVAHLDPQRGGCCTTMPYFIGRILEIPVTVTQDYMLFHLLGQYSIDLWKRQIQRIFAGNGLASFVVHPDYVIEQKARHTYTELLRYLSKECDERNVWMALPGEVNRWWRNRSEMRLVQNGPHCEIAGPGKEDARVAYAMLEGEALVYRISDQSAPTERRLIA